MKAAISVPVKVLSDGSLYITGSGRIHCGRIHCAGVTAAVSGVDIHGARVVRLTPDDAAFLMASGIQPECESCKSTVNVGSRQ